MKPGLTNGYTPQVSSDALPTHSTHPPTASSSVQATSYLGHSYAEFVSGYCAACTSITLLFPLNKLIFRQMLGGISPIEAFGQIKSEGVSNIYRGLLPPLLQKSTSYSIMFGTQNEYFVLIKRLCQNSESPLIRRLATSNQNLAINGVAGGLAGLTEAILTPLERVQAVLQMQKFHSSYRHTWHVFEELIKEHGVKELYRGTSAICMRNSLSNCFFFTLRSPLKEMFPHTNNQFENSLYDFLSGGMLGAFISTLFYPLNVTKSNMQAKIGGNFPGIYATFRLIYEARDKKIALIFKGVGGNFSRALLAWGITNSVYEMILKYLKHL